MCEGNRELPQSDRHQADDTCQSSAAAALSLPRPDGSAPPPSNDTYGGGNPSCPAIKKYAARA